MKQVFSRDELYVQELANDDQIAKTRTHMVMNSHLNKFFARFLENQLLFTITSLDEHTKVWVSIISGTPNLIKVIDFSTIKIDKTLVISPLEDVFFKNIQHHNNVGLLFIDWETNKRYRLNGKIKQEGSDLVINIKETYGSYSKYIQQRNFEYTNISTVPIKLTQGTEIIQSQKSLIENTNTFLLGTGNHKKTNISYKEGKLRFVEFINNNTLRVSDYVGNNMFNPLENLHEKQNAGLTFIDYKTNSMLQLTGLGEIQFDQKKDLDLAQSGNKRRLWIFKIDSWIFTENFNQINWKFINYSPFIS